VDLVQVDPVGLEPAQRCVDCIADVATRRATTVGIVAQRHPELRRQHDPVAVAPAGQPAPDDRL
jgi:hypothetical protein